MPAGDGPTLPGRRTPFGTPRIRAGKGRRLSDTVQAALRFASMGQGGVSVKTAEDDGLKVAIVDMCALGRLGLEWALRPLPGVADVCAVADPTGKGGPG